MSKRSSSTPPAACSTSVREKLSDSGWNTCAGSVPAFKCSPPSTRATVDPSAKAARCGAAITAAGPGRRRCRTAIGRQCWCRPASTARFPSPATNWGSLFARDPATAQNIPCHPAPRPRRCCWPMLKSGSTCFCVDIGGRLWTVRQLSAAGGTWGSWQKLKSPSAAVGLTGIALGSTQHGRLQVFAIGADAIVHADLAANPGRRLERVGHARRREPGGHRPGSRAKPGRPSWRSLRCSSRTAPAMSSCRTIGKPRRTVAGAAGRTGRCRPPARV